MPREVSNKDSYEALYIAEYLGTRPSYSRDKYSRANTMFYVLGNSKKYKVNSSGIMHE